MTSDGSAGRDAWLIFAEHHTVEADFVTDKRLKIDVDAIYSALFGNQKLIQINEC
ncbi:MAG: hypothetical protein ACRCWW_03070 [Scandinavium sp.]|uniref:hypothetical protein n=1 Tax=Scandinavium sp. TaxID=2830653 RepID=UPI003F2CBF09